MEITKCQFSKLTVHEKLDILFDNTSNIDLLVKEKARNTAFITTVIILVPILIALVV